MKKIMLLACLTIICAVFALVPRTTKVQGSVAVIQPRLLELANSGYDVVSYSDEGQIVTVMLRKSVMENTLRKFGIETHR